MQVTVLSIFAVYGGILLLYCGGVSSSDLVIYDINTQPTCTEVIERGPRNDCRWPAGMNSLADQVIEGGRIIAYQIRWLGGAWSGWFVPGVNDLDVKFNPISKTCEFNYRANTLRRFWSYMTDHTHKFIICSKDISHASGGSSIMSSSTASSTSVHTSTIRTTHASGGSSGMPSLNASLTSFNTSTITTTPSFGDSFFSRASSTAFHGGTVCFIIALVFVLS